MVVLSEERNSLNIRTHVFMLVVYQQLMLCSIHPDHLKTHSFDVRVLDLPALINTRFQNESMTVQILFLEYVIMELVIHSI